jgi:Flp pilus assembly protein TadG
MNAQWKQVVKTFRSDERGAVAILFGIMTFVLFIMGALAIDYSRAIDMRSRIMSAVDAASLAAGRALLDGKLSDAEISDLANAFFNENVKAAKAMGTVGQPSVKIDRATGSIDIGVESSVKMTLARVGGITEMDIPVSSAATFQQKDIEVGMALDITGSMNEPANGKTKIASLKAAFELFVDRLIPEQRQGTNRVRIGLAPYSSGINLGAYAANASANRSQDGCVTERQDGQIIDAAASSIPFMVAADNVNDIDNSDGYTPKNAYTCPSATLVPLTDDRDRLIQAVNSFAAQGWTAGHLGVQWAWNLVSDQWSTTFGGENAPDPYARVKQNKLIKAVILMTDGSFNTAYHGSSISNGKWSKSQALAMCDAMKAAGKDVVVFSVAFDAPLDAQETLKACASSGDRYYANASNAEELERAFNNFAIKLTSLRISK